MDKHCNSEKLISFWTTLISEKGLIPQVHNVMEITDFEERAIALFSRVSFLWLIGLNYERKELKEALHRISKILDGPKSACNQCADIKKLIGDTLIRVKNESDIIGISNTNNENIHKNKKGTNCEIENSGTTLKMSNCQRILAPETECYIPKEICLTHDDDDVVIPETAVEENSYGNTDFFENFVELSRSTSPILGKLNKSSSSPASYSCKDAFNCKVDQDVFSNKENILSPIKKSTPHRHSPDSSHKSPSILAFESSPQALKEVTDVGEKNLRTTKRIYSHSKEHGKRILNDSKFSNLASHESSDDDSVIETDSDFKLQNKFITNFHLSKRPQKGEQFISEGSKLRKMKIFDPLKRSNLNVEVDIVPNSFPNTKKLKQTKISKDGFIKKTNVVKVTGGLATVTDADIDVAIKESLRTKEVEDMMRKKSQSLNKETPTKLRKVTSSSPQLLDVKKSFHHRRTSSGSDAPHESEHTCKMTKDEVLAQVENEVGGKAQEHLGSPSKKRKKQLSFDNSFDALPCKGKKDFAFKEDVIRKQSERKRLAGWDCKECEEYFRARGVTEAEKKEVLNRCSRHRSKHAAVTSTPEGFWHVGWKDD